ncbi:MAG: vWA domain-containing protein [Polyangiaceae bacterium]
MRRGRKSTRSGAAIGAALLPLLSIVGASCGARSALVDGVADRDSSIITPIDATFDVETPDVVDAETVSCTPGQIALNPATPVVEFVLDTSNSMELPLDTSSPTSKWDALRGALASALPPIDATTEIGAYIFPSSPGQNTCDTGPGAALEPKTNNVEPLLFKMLETTPHGGTPTALAIQYAATDLQSLRTATSARALVLATDGSLNCDDNLDGLTCTCTAPPDPRSGFSPCRDPHDGQEDCLDDKATEAAISTYTSQGIPTYVIGIESTADAQFESVLSAMAIAGGRPQAGPTPYYEARSSADLNAAVSSIRDSVASCTYLTTSVPDTDGSIIVTLDGVTLPFDPTHTNGWDWSDKANGEILLSGAACTQAAGEASPQLFAVIVCGDLDAAPDGPGDAPADAESGG